MEYLWVKNISTTASKLKFDGTVINKCWRIRRGLVVVIILLHALITIEFADNWSFLHSGFIENGQNFQTISRRFGIPAGSDYLAAGIAASICTILTDLYMVCVTLLEIHNSSSAF